MQQHRRDVRAQEIVVHPQGRGSPGGSIPSFLSITHCDLSIIQHTYHKLVFHYSLICRCKQVFHHSPTLRCNQVFCHPPISWHLSFPPPPNLNELNSAESPDHKIGGEGLIFLAFPDFLIDQVLEFPSLPEFTVSHKALDVETEFPPIPNFTSDFPAFPDFMAGRSDPTPDTDTAELQAQLLSSGLGQKN